LSDFENAWRQFSGRFSSKYRTFAAAARLVHLGGSMKKILVCSILVAAMALVAAAADVSGKWSGSISHEGGQANTAFAILKQSGTAITGSAGPDEGQQWPDLKGTIRGDKVTVEVKSPEDGTVYKCDLVLVGDHLTGEVNATSSGSQTMKGKMDIARVK